MKANLMRTGNPAGTSSPTTNNTSSIIASLREIAILFENRKAQIRTKPRNRRTRSKHPNAAVRHSQCRVVRAIDFTAFYRPVVCHFPVVLIVLLNKAEEARADP
jgi:hypothetical protein